jgi:hypothetical protein
MTDISDAIKDINPDAEFEVLENNPNTIRWINGTSPISVSDLEARVALMNTRDAHITPRQRAYPPLDEQLDMQYHDKKDGTTTWEDAIQAVKDAHPKP